MAHIELPESTRKRFVQLLQILKNWTSEKITSVYISEITGWSPSLIRHDFWLIKFNKGVSNGYNSKELKTALEVALGIEIETNADKKALDSLNSDSLNADGFNSDDFSSDEFNYNRTKYKNVCIVGLGRLGAALLDNSFIEHSCFKIKAGFDSNLNRVEILRSNFPLYPASEMDFVIKKEKIEYAILTVPDKDAQNMTNRLLKAGITGIVNMTNVLLTVPENVQPVKIENLSILNALNLVI